MRGKLREAFARQRPDLQLPARAWRTPWVVHATAWGTGQQAVLDYLARYLFRVAITNNRIVAVDDEAVTIRYKKRKANRLRTCRIEGDDFIRRFLSHVLPKGLHKVRYFGLWHPSKRARAQQARLLLAAERRVEPAPQPASEPQADTPAARPNIAAALVASRAGLSTSAASNPATRAAHDDPTTTTEHPDRAIQRNGHQPVLAIPLPGKPDAPLQTLAAVAQPGPDSREIGRSDRHPRHRARRRSA